MTAPLRERQDALSLHRCKVCGTAWLLWPVGTGGAMDATWNLLDQYQRPGSCCDNVPMGAQIEHLRDLPLTVVASGDESLRVEHARKQGAADGFQQGWHAALTRISEGDAVADLIGLCPEPAALEARAPEDAAEKSHVLAENLSLTEHQRQEIESALIEYAADVLEARAPEPQNCRCGHLKGRHQITNLGNITRCSDCGCERFEARAPENVPCKHCGGLPPGEASSAGDLCYCPPEPPAPQEDQR